ncbi:MATE family efflux transporter [Kineosporia babensis]|uniref:O-antigen/teichoic acid export membrane protein n=1 Tax=Kineosporia babensis TaxID=499548 RepID=A0A9X1NCU0_9ACTN|nr:hypothetical protein [Kineosporia babensis]MCD5311750.1 hypothetical protein [Kineosporia babensis]
MTQLVGAGAGVMSETAQPGQAVDPMRARAWWKVADQILSGLSVVGLSFVVARSVGVSHFGVFGVALLASGFVLGLSRAMVSDVFLIQFSDVVPRVRRQAAKEATGAAVLLGLVTGLLCCLAAALLPGRDLGMALFAIGLALPGLLVQDALRFVFIAAGRPAPAFALGLSGAGAQFGVVGLLVAADHDSMFPITLGWGAVALLTAGLGCLLARLLPSLRQARLWFALNRHLTVRGSLEYVLSLGALYLAYCLIGAVVGLAAIGSLWAAQMFLVPAYVAITATGSLLASRFDTWVQQGRPLRRPALLTGLVLAVMAALWGAAITVVPDAVGIHLTGPTWQGARAVLEPAVVGVVMLGLASGPGLALRAAGHGTLLRQVALLQAMLLLGLGLLGADLHGVRGAAMGLVAAHAIGALTLWALFLRESGRRRDVPVASVQP